MPKGPTVKVRDKQTGHEYYVSEARFRGSPDLWERLTDEKPKVTVDEAAARKGRRQSPDRTEAAVDAASESPETSAPLGGEAPGHTPGHQAESSRGGI